MSVDAIVRQSSLGKFETYWALDNLLRGGIIMSVNDSAPTEEVRNYSYEAGRLGQREWREENGIAEPTEGARSE